MIHSLGIFPEYGLHWSVFSSLRPEHTLLTSSCCSSDAVSIQRCCIPPTSPIQISIRGQYVTFISSYACCSQRKCLMSSKHSINLKRGGWRWRDPIPTDGYRHGARSQPLVALIPPMPSVRF